MYKSLKQVLKHEHGFTFVESIFQLAVYALFAQLFIILMLWTANYDTSALTKEHTEWELFINDYLHYLTKGQKIEVINNGKGISIQTAEQRINIEKYHQMVRKRIDGLGHEPMLMGIKDIDFAHTYNRLSISVEFLNGLKKERELVVPLRKE